MLNVNKLIELNNSGISEIKNLFPDNFGKALIKDKR